MQRDRLNKYRIPDSPGVYLFKKGRKILYIGKATSLRDRVRSYFSSDLVAGRGERILGMVAAATSVTWQKTDSVLEALILEANLIKKHQPSYNIDEKDNKSFNYVVITKEDFPRVLIVRGRELFGQEKKIYIPKVIFGPFPHSLKEALKIVRKIFPFRDTCLPCDASVFVNSNELANKKERKKVGVECRPCFNRQIGLCPGVCSGEVNEVEYAKTIRNLREFFSGNFKGLKQRLVREMKVAAAAERFEDASQLRRQINALEHIRDVSLIKDEYRIMGGGSLASCRNTRIEAFDVAHTSGKETVGVMTVVVNGEPDKTSYRKFKIRSVGNDDVAALKEVLSRRLNHPEWPLPRVFVIDGGKGQLRAAEAVLKGAGLGIPLVGVVKDERHKPRNLIGDKASIEAHERHILLANNEAHRFSTSWHKKRLRARMY